MSVDKNILLDLRGQICPSTLLLALRAISLHQDRLRGGGQTLIIRTDHRDATATIPAMAKNMGYTVEVRKEKGCYLLLIGREDPAPENE